MFHKASGRHRLFPQGVVGLGWRVLSDWVCSLSSLVSLPASKRVSKPNRCSPEESARLLGLWDPVSVSCSLSSTKRRLWQAPCVTNRIPERRFRLPKKERKKALGQLWAVAGTDRKSGLSFRLFFCGFGRCECQCCYQRNPPVFPRHGKNPVDGKSMELVSQVIGILRMIYKQSHVLGSCDNLSKLGLVPGVGVRSGVAHRIRNGFRNRVRPVGNFMIH